jgi:hypothetical protein
MLPATEVKVDKSADTVVLPPGVVASPPSQPKAPARAIITPDLTIKNSVLGEESSLPPAAASGSVPYAHALDYGCLTGEVQVALRGVRLRYAQVDQDDRYGGSVTLLADPVVAGLRDGQMVRFRGQLLSPESRTPAPSYKVVSVELLH